MTGRACRTLVTGAVILGIRVITFAQSADDPLRFQFSGGYGQVEVGGPFAGAEFHESRPLPSRISLYAPVANSIDLSRDYWKRGDSRPCAVGICVDQGRIEWLGRDEWSYSLSPHTVLFEKTVEPFHCAFRYSFGLHEPIMALRMSFVNTSSSSHHLETYFHLKTTLRTCQTYARYDSADMSYEPDRGAVVARFRQPQTDDAVLFVQNEKTRPSGWELNARELGVSDSGTADWRGVPLPGEEVTPGSRDGCAAFTYDRDLDPGDSLVVNLVIGSCGERELGALLDRLPATWAEDVQAYDREVREQSEGRPAFGTGDFRVDRSAVWAQALLATNAHYLDGTVVPMPCPAEYNFFFTHDMLLTDLAAVAFDPERVKRDLLFLKAHARDNVIPHAYYWRDDGFKTEYCPPDDWNHLWFILATATYLRHTMDTATVQSLYPLVTRSLSDAMRRLGKDHLMYAGAPDWWDIGNNPGPRAYMTILVIRALGEYTAMSAVLGQRLQELPRLEHTATLMKASLKSVLWDAKRRYLMNINRGKKDPHWYMGSLLAPVFGVLDPVRSRALVSTAERELLAPGVGIRTVMPADFHTQAIRTAMHFVDNEAGDPYLYANGGVWPHDNAWYALALRATGRMDDAYAFYRSMMTMDGVAQSPMGQPAFYEYRFSDQSSPAYGRIDKPSFLWAAGFTLYTAYRFLGFDEQEWNLSVGSSVPRAIDTAGCTFTFGGEVHVSVERGANGFVADGKEVPSNVVPLSLCGTKEWEIGLSSGTGPRLLSVNAVLHRISVDPRGRSLRLSVSSFKGHRTETAVWSVAPPRRVTLNESVVGNVHSQKEKNGYVTTLSYGGSEHEQMIAVEF
jgi:hypothetical protein